MAATRLTCPECNATLKPAQPVPDGKKVKCPKCGVPFISPGAVAREVFELSEEDEAPAAPKAKPAAAKAKKAAPAKAKAAPKKPEPAAKKPADDDEDEGGTYGFLPGEEPKGEDEEDDKPEIDYAPDMSIRDLRGPAVTWVMRPSTWLLKCGVMGVLGWVGLIVAILIPICFPLPRGEERPALAFRKGVGGLKGGGFADMMMPGGGMPEGMPGGMPGGMQGGGMQGGGGQGGAQQTREKKEIKEAEEDEYENSFTVFGIDLIPIWLPIVIFSVVGVFYSAVIVVGAIKMQNLESRSWGMVGAIMSLIPLNILGLELSSYILVFFLVRIFMKAAEIPVLYIWVFVNSYYIMSIAAGIWSIVVLNKKEVLDGFEYVPE
jgi:hypothetical protein